MGKEKDYIIVEASYGSLELISNFIQKKSSLLGLSFKKTWELMLTVDEICSSIITSKNNESNIIKVTWESMPNFIKIEIMDDGIPLNPLEINDPDYGLGVQLIKEMVDYFEYKRENSYNVVILKKYKRNRRK
ncbi:MAG: ATP-binding protein [Candidatus Omnitrophica bacterium]|nr:ATP-binding protein [Candidatus Omnitrophota bacterium]MCM8802925.1 ATP-binding protein [Candidatus Omnitrophota bacterium]